MFLFLEEKNKSRATHLSLLALCVSVTNTVAPFISCATRTKHQPPSRLLLLLTCTLQTILSGVTPRCDQYLELWPDGFETYNVMVPNLFDIPFCDFGVGTLNPDIRSIAAYVTSR